MLDAHSRYADCAVLHLRDADGADIAYRDRRLIADDLPRIAEVVVEDCDRLDRIANRAYGEPTQAWRIMDANPVREPLALADTPGRRLGIARPGGV